MKVEPTLVVPRVATQVVTMEATPVAATTMAAELLQVVEVELTKIKAPLPKPSPEGEGDGWEEKGLQMKKGCVSILFLCAFANNYEL